MNDSRELLDFVKAMADADRLRIIGVLARQRANKSEIADRLHMPLRDVVDHLAFLENVGIISLKDDLYELNAEKIEGIARGQLREEKPEYVPAPDLDEKSRKVLVSCLEPDGTIKRLPSQPSQLRVILNYLVQAFTPGVDYTEKEVNTIIRRFHVDVSGLRRDLVDAGLMDRERDGSRYWRTDGPERRSGSPRFSDVSRSQSKGPSTTGFDTAENTPTQPSAQDEERTENE
jgi:hypothetical protein